MSTVRAAEAQFIIQLVQLRQLYTHHRWLVLYASKLAFGNRKDRCCGFKASTIRYSIHRGAATSVAAVLTVLATSQKYPAELQAHSQPSLVTMIPSSAVMVPPLVSGQLYVVSMVTNLEIYFMGI
ncbi:hypothetical protein BDN71DRAFT_1436843 [Pleurotus eryngii]|uniref:Uncharacterized protein n=1 Tax=Pleurotus eryngii TaxID=5323 RepID=A0A9P5ZHV6_PLEER|nr:hypothetical protein BDN71DRAFT_1436843 [Pleurotus eryngii]